jgi:hypothetical protein
MFIGETILVVTALCSGPPKKRQFEDQDYTVTSHTQGCFQLASGSSLETKLTDDIGDIPGVRSVNVAPTEGGLDVLVVLEKLEFSTYEKVINRELELFEKFPHLTVRFNVEPFTGDDGPLLAYVA